MINRRQFLARCSTGLVGAALLTRLPLKYLSTETKRIAATEYLSKHWHNYVKGKGRGNFDMAAGGALFDAFEGELIANQRFVSHETGAAGHALMFKAHRLYRNHDRGWYVEFRERV